jgi:adenylate kinase
MSLNAIMLGPPGAGKGTQGERLAACYGVPRIATGDILREAVQSGSRLGRLARATMEAGKLVGDDMMIGIVRERLTQRDAAHGFVLDGFPRTVPQAEALDALVAAGAPLVVLQLVAPLDVLVRRLSSRRICSVCGTNAAPGTAEDAACPKCGGTFVQRSDDSEAVVRERLRVYEEQTRPLVEYYRERPTYYVIDGNQSPELVAAALQRAVETAAPVASRRAVMESES